MPFFGTPVIRGGTASPLTFAKNPNLQDGDVVLLALRSQEGSSLTNWNAANAGFTEVTKDLTGVTAGILSAKRVGGIWLKKVTNAATEPASYTVGGPANRCVGAMIIFRPDDGGSITVLGQSDYGSNTTTNGVTVIFERQNAEAVGISLLLMGAECTAGISHVPTQLPSGYTALVNAQNTLNSSTTGSRTAMWLGWKALNSKTFTQVSGGWAGSSASAIYEATVKGGGQTVVTPTYPGLPIKTGAGDSLLTVINSQGLEVVPTSLETWLPGFDNHAQLESRIGATWAHRGGSANWPEMSEWAYDHAVTRGYGVLEFSAARTSDGWWFGLHDQTTDRTSGGSFGTAASQTRAQIEAQRIVNGATGGPRKYYGLIEFLQKYGRTHVLILDFKYEFARQNEFLDLVVANMDPSRAVYKAFGTGSGGAGAAVAAKSRGMKSWGYFYQDDYDNGSLAQWAVSYDYLGMDIGATTAWTGPNNVLSYGKPVVGHIAQSQADYNLAVSKGATMVQCANVLGIKPVSVMN